MKKQIFIVGIIVLLIVGFSGCTEDVDTKSQDGNEHIYNNQGNQTDYTQDTENKTEWTTQKPGCEDYVLQTTFSNPLNLSANNLGPGGCTNLESCIHYCNKNNTTECRDWIQSIYISLSTSNQIEIAGKYNGIWLPTIDTIRDAVKRIPTLKADGINTVSFGPDVATKHVDTTMTVGDNLIRFYIKVFEDAGFNVHLVPNSMHFGNNDVYLHELNSILLTWAEEAEKLDTKFYTTFNEVDGMSDSIENTSDWLQEMLPQVKERYSGIVCVQPTQPAFCDTDDPTSPKLNYSGFDCVSTFFPLMVPDSERNDRAITDFTNEAQRIKSEYLSVKYVMFNDVATFSGSNWAETGLMEAQFEALARDDCEYATESEQAEIFENFFEKAYQLIDGCFFNNYRGFTFIGRSAEQVLKDIYAKSGTIPVKTTDSLWATPGFVELIENVTMNDIERELIFDIDTYVAGWAGLCFEPTSTRQGPFDCMSIPECMECFRENPEDYWAWTIENCGDI